MGKPKPIVLYTSPVLQHPPIGGPCLRVENSIKALSQISDLYIYSRVPLSDMGGERALSYFYQLCKGFYFGPDSNRIVRFIKKSINYLPKKIIHRVIFQIDSGLAREDFGHFLRITNTIRPDVIWLGYGNISYPLLKDIKNRSDYKVVVDTDSIWSRYLNRRSFYAQNDQERAKLAQAGKAKEEEERLGAQLADVTTAVSEIDAAYYREHARSPKQIHIFSNVIDFDHYQQVPAPPDDLKRPSIYLAGTFFPGSPMEDATRWVIRDILPKIQQQIPDIHMYIAGQGSDSILSDVKSRCITVLGKLPSVLPYLCHTNVALVPLRAESGTRFKILEAGACSIPVVSTVLGAEGIPVTHRKDILIGDEPGQFANHVIELIKNPELASRLAENLRSLVIEQFAIPSLVHEGELILDYLLA
jgi:glycosyltransferase involved in cell wall biosynthesis